MKQPKPPGWEPPGIPPRAPFGTGPMAAAYARSAAEGNPVPTTSPEFDRMLLHQTRCEDCYWHEFDGQGWKIDPCPTGAALEAIYAQAKRKAKFDGRHKRS